MYGKMQAVLAITVLSTALSVQAGDQFAMLDTDGSGTLSKEEASASPALVAAWDQLDADADGQLTKEEFSRFAASGQGAGGRDKGVKYQPATNK